MNTKLKGNISEIKVIAKLVEKGYTVSLPFGDNARYDLIFDDASNLYRVQVKSARLKDNYIEFSTSSSSAHRGGVRRDYKKDVDFVALYCNELNEVYLVPITECTSTSMRLRISEPVGKNQHPIKYAKDFVI